MSFNDYEKLDPYHQYGDPNDPSPYEILNQMKSWNKAITLQVTALDESTEAKFQVMDDRITASVIDINTQITTNFNVLNGRIELKVAKGEAIADINVTPGLVKIRADKVELSGYATFTSLATAGMTSIHGANIITGTVVAEKIAAGQITAGHLQVRTITADRIALGAITANEISTGAVTANAISSYAIQSYPINSYAISADKISTGAITSDKIQAYAINASHISVMGLSADIINGGTINSSIINVSTDVTIGKTLRIGTHYQDYEEKTIMFGGFTGGRIRHYGDQLLLSALSGVRVQSDLYVDGNFGNVAKAHTTGLGIAYSSATTPKRIYFRLYGNDLGYVELK